MHEGCETRMRKVLIYAYPSIGQNFGGLQIQINNTVTHLRKIGYEVKYFNQWEDKMEDYDIFHCFYLGDISVLPLLVRAKERGVKIVMSTVYNSALDYPKEKITHWLSRLSPSICYVKYVQRQMVSLVDYFCALSGFEKQQITRIFNIPKEKIEVIPNGIDELFIQSDPQKDNRFIKEYGIKNYVLHVGQFNQNKNQISLIRALQDLEVPLVCIGQITDRTYYQKCMELKKDNMIFLQPVPNASGQLVDIYSGASMFVLPSIREAYPLTVLEALACDTQVLVTKNSMIGNDLEPYGLIKINPRNNLEIKKHIQKLYKNDTQNIRKRAFQKEHFSWNEIIKKVDKVYQEVLNEKNCN